jgi:hypothetical protein
MRARRFDWMPADLILIHRVLGRCLRHRKYRYENATLVLGTELKFAVDQGEQRVIAAHADIATGMPLGSALACDDVAGGNILTAEYLDPQPPAR